MQASDPFGWVGSIIDGQFAVEALAGEGAFGVVYRARHLGFDAPVAVKCLKIPAGLSLSSRTRFLAKFREEARLLHQLSRRTMGIVQALDIGAAAAPKGPWTPYIVMEWLEGETLEQDLRRRRAENLPPRSLAEAIKLLAPVASALAVAHDENVSHRDVKPANLFLRRRPHEGARLRHRQGLLRDADVRRGARPDGTNVPRLHAAVRRAGAVQPAVRRHGAMDRRLRDGPHPRRGRQRSARPLRQRRDPALRRVERRVDPAELPLPRGERERRRRGGPRPRARDQPRAAVPQPRRDVVRPGGRPALQRRRRGARHPARARVRPGRRGRDDDGP